MQSGEESFSSGFFNPVGRLHILYYIGNLPLTFTFKVDMWSYYLLFSGSSLLLHSAVKSIVAEKGHTG